MVGTGSPASCTSSALASAVAKGGVIVFDCGTAPTTIAIDQTLEAPIDRDTVIDGGNRVTLDGRGQTRVLRFASPNFRAIDYGITLQHLRVVGGKTTPTVAIPTAPAPCSQGFNDGEGGAVYVRDGSLTVIDSVFEDNQGAPLGPDTGGGAIYVVGSKHGVTIVKSTFKNNKASNGAGVGTLFAQLDVYDSLFTGNVATGNGANYDDASKCDAINNGQHEVGSGGNGGALYSDGASVNVSLCGTAIVDNHAGGNAFGGGLFFTSNDFGGTLTIRDTTMTGNTGGHWTVVATHCGRPVSMALRPLALLNANPFGPPILLDDNVHGIHQLPVGIVVVTGLGHMMTNRGALYIAKLVRPGKYEVTRWKTLPGAPEKSGMMPDGNLFVSCAGGDVVIKPDGRMEMARPKP